MVKKYIVALSETERQMLEQMITRGKQAADQSNHARILLKADQNQPGGSWCDVKIKEALDTDFETLQQAVAACD